jgi:hypothetical protein
MGLTLATAGGKVEAPCGTDDTPPETADPTGRRGRDGIRFTAGTVGTPSVGGTVGTVFTAGTVGMRSEDTAVAGRNAGGAAGSAAAVSGNSRSVGTRSP